MILNAKPSVANTRVDNPGTYVLCDGRMFDKGITYSSTYIENIFPIIWGLILDARAMLRSLVFTQCGIGASQTIQSSNVTIFMVQLTYLSGMVGQPIELGLQCRSTGRTTKVSAAGTSIISLVRHNS